MKIINNIKDLHGMRSNCNKFTINIEKGYLAVACNFHDKDRIVYSESVDNMNGILYDLYKVFNFPQYKIVTEKPVSDIGLSILVDKDNKKLAIYDSKNGKITFRQWHLYELFGDHDCWEVFAKLICDKYNCKVVDI